MRGDLTLLDEIDGASFPPDLLDRAAAYGRWDLVHGLLDRGAPLSTEGQTALHTAAGAGEVELVRALLTAGADAGLRDPTFRATPRQWAEFLNHPDAAALLPDDRPEDDHHGQA
jgi:ankyrin repeat protein